MLLFVPLIVVSIKSNISMEYFSILFIYIGFSKSFTRMYGNKNSQINYITRSLFSTFFLSNLIIKFAQKIVVENKQLINVAFELKINRLHLITKYR